MNQALEHANATMNNDDKKIHTPTHNYVNCTQAKKHLGKLLKATVMYKRI
jgi:hypothetical protein